MYIAMNRFEVAEGKEEIFEAAWRDRDRFLADVPGFRTFRLLRGSPRDGVTVFLSHSAWDSHPAFEAWTESEAFRKAHGDARLPDGVVLGPPRFEGFEVVLTT
jgi:heme-degrading monooxygenase HmoA